MSKKFDNMKKLNNLEKSIQSLTGFSDKKTKVYLTLLELGEASVASIAAMAQLKRTTVYSILPELQSEGHVSLVKRSGKKTYFIEDPRNLKVSLEERAKMIDSVIPHLQSLHNVFPYKTKITLYEGVGGIKDIYREVVNSVAPGDTILSYTGMTDFQRVFPEEIGDYYVKERVKKKIINRTITTDSIEAKKWKARAKEELREVKIIKDSAHAFSGDMKIFANKVAFLSYKENFMGVIIESKEISAMHRSWYDKFWELI